MNPNDILPTPGQDLNDPAQLEALLRDQASGLEQQAIAAQQGSALGGHPFPAYFYGRTAEVCRAGAAMIRQRLLTPGHPAAPGPHPPAASGVASAPINPPAPEPPVTGSMPSGDERKKAKAGA